MIIRSSKDLWYEINEEKEVGFEIVLGGKEVSEHLNKRALHHRVKADKLKAMSEEDLVERHSCDDYRYEYKRAGWFTFLATHVRPDVEYTFTVTDLDRLEFDEEDYD